MRCHAYQLPSEVYRDLEAQILEQLRVSDREQLLYLVGEHDLSVEFLSGEWRVLFAAAQDYYQVVKDDAGMARMVVSPDELADFVRFLRDPVRQRDWASISFGIAELADALPVDCDLVGVVFIEESDDWLWTEPVNELIALRPEVYDLLKPHLHRLLELQHWSALARLAGDHGEGAVEFSPDQWRNLVRQAQKRVPELVPVLNQRLADPADYTTIRETLSLLADPRFQPSLDAWLRVHADTARYALYFRQADLERRQLEAPLAAASGS